NKVLYKKLNRELTDLLQRDGLTPEAEEKVNQLLKELREWLHYYDWLSRLIEFFESEEVFQYVPKTKESSSLK
ncbi:GbsR/MarR family transcriptional regulator, partial [Bacillus spizizenii]|nr:GbsR/MarR family transcriptional regulator [Bacillus spizizenii]